MSDRRAVSAGHLGASSVAAMHEMWRVAVGGTRVEQMTVEQIAQAFRAGQLSARTPLWPPGATAWQALGNFEYFQASQDFQGSQGSGGRAAPGQHEQAAHGGLSQFEESDDDPTRMWTGGAEYDLPGYDLPGYDQGSPALPGAAAQRASSHFDERPPARTGTRPIAPAPPPRSVPTAAAAPRPAPMAPPAPAPRSMPVVGAAASAAPTARPVSVTSAGIPAARRSRGNGLLLVAGLVGLVGLGSAILTARSGSDEPAAAVEAAASPEPAAAAPSPSVAPPGAPEAEAASAGGAQLAKYEEEAAASGPSATAPAPSAAAAAAPAPPGAASDAVDGEEAEAPSARESSEVRQPEPAPKASSKRVASRAASKRAAPRRAARPRARAAKVERAVERPEKAVKAEKAVAEAAPERPPAANAAVNEAAAAALANAATLASSCRPRGGPSGSGKARVIYSNDGDVQSVEILTAKFRDTLTGSCVRMVFRRAKIPAFKGEPPTFIKSFTIPAE